VWNFAFHTEQITKSVSVWELDDEENYGDRRKKIKEGRRKPYDEELHNLQSLALSSDWQNPRRIWRVCAKRGTWGIHTAVLVEKHKKRTRCGMWRKTTGSKTEEQMGGRDNVNWIHLVQNRNQWQHILSPLGLWIAVNFLTTWGINSF